MSTTITRRLARLEWLERRRWSASSSSPLKRLANFVSYSMGYARLPEYRYVLAQLPPARRERHLLDIGFGSSALPLFLARDGDRVVAVDNDPRNVAAYQALVDRLGYNSLLKRQILQLHQADARSLPYDNHSFDAVYSVSALEHIPGSGDTAAVREMARVCRPGGRVILTLPYSRHYHEGSVRVPVGRSWYEDWGRGYDDQALRARIIDQTGLVVRDLAYYGEPVLQVQARVRAAGHVAQVLARGIQPLLASIFIRRLRPEQRERAGLVCVTLAKHAAGSRVAGGYDR